MRARRTLAAISVVVLGAVLAGCDNDGDDSGNGDSRAQDGDQQDGGSGRTVSDADWLRAADDACASAQRAIDTIPRSSASLSDPENAEQLGQAGEYLGNLIVHIEALVEDLDDMAQPATESDAETANQVVDALGKALASLRSAHDAAGSSDAATYPAAYETFTGDYRDFADKARSAGLTQCGQAISG